MTGFGGHGAFNPLLQVPGVPWIQVKGPRLRAGPRTWQHPCPLLLRTCCSEARGTLCEASGDFCPLSQSLHFAGNHFPSLSGSAPSRKTPSRQFRQPGTMAGDLAGRGTDITKSWHMLARPRI